ncbi:MAG: hypothetical protein FWG87_01155 [Defluviitaleaceae bacterium]|nr:hypothetical protein [Defluviitaleaceae bacterium]
MAWVHDLFLVVFGWFLVMYLRLPNYSIKWIKFQLTKCGFKRNGTRIFADLADFRGFFPCELTVVG